ncbi:WD40/YVTN/BNR-like repeat-containing protein [Legionella fallonii]|uniref:NHL repeat protein n=1 Tax=Legionella fallonii LLAP-10 TaxID=1212491 RepID=A0A098G941_9GAMM|nr:sialidase family protein [Legionella fallonii]CEG58519.1 conserved exported protein of unknown function [Legionella fallonii LLAP-10]
MKKNKLPLGLLCFIYSLCSPMFVHATAKPLFAISPLTFTTIPVSSNGTAIVQYTVTNQSSRSHTLTMVSNTSAVTQITSPGNCPKIFTLPAQQACTLTLQVNGNQIHSPVSGGPKICQLGPDGKPSPLLCYQPSDKNILNITVTAPPVPTFYAGTQNGRVYYSINNGDTWSETNPPAGGSAVNGVTAINGILYTGNANGNVYYSINNGNTWSTVVTPAPGFAVNGLFVSANYALYIYKLYIASGNGKIFICTLNGTNCAPTNPPAAGFAVNGVFVATNGLYAASANGSVYYSNNNGISWTAINGQPDGSAVKTVYVADNILYIGTANEYVYTSTSLTGGGSWTPYAQSVYSLLVNSDGSIVDAGTQGGYVFSLLSGNEVGFITYSPINSLFLSA